MSLLPGWHGTDVIARENDMRNGICPDCGEPFHEGVCKWATELFNQINQPKMESTIVQCTCVSKKESQNYNPEHPVSTAIELQVPYDQNSIYYQMSGGTNFLLNTVNEEAAKMFALGGKYDIVISPSKVTG